MTGIFTYIWLIFMVNVGKYTIYTWMVWDIVLTAMIHMHDFSFVL